MCKNPPASSVPLQITSTLRNVISKVAAGEKVGSGEAEENSDAQEEETLPEKYYNKSKCFFDNVSSDLKPR